MGTKPDDNLEPEVPIEGEVQNADPIETELGTVPPDSKPKLLAGKYKTQEELEQAYIESQKKITTTSQERAALETEKEKLLAALDPIKANGWDLDEEYNWVQTNPPNNPPVTTQTNTGGNPPTDYETKFNEDFFENPLASLAKLTQSMKQVEKAAAAQRRRVKGNYKNDPLFSFVEDEFEAALIELDDAQMANPENAKFVAEQVYNNVTGKYTRDNLKNLGDTPEERIKNMKKLGIESPQTTTTGDDSLYPKAQVTNMADGLGLTPEQAARAAARAEKRAKGEL